MRKTNPDGESTFNTFARQKVQTIPWTLWLCTVMHLNLGKTGDGGLPNSRVQAWASHTINEGLIEKRSQLTLITLTDFWSSNGYANWHEIRHCQVKYVCTKQAEPQVQDTSSRSARTEQSISRHAHVQPLPGVVAVIMSRFSFSPAGSAQRNYYAVCWGRIWLSLPPPEVP